MSGLSWPIVYNSPIPLFVLTGKRQVTTSQPTSGTWILFPQINAPQGVTTNNVTVSNDKRSVWVQILPTDIESIAPTGSTRSASQVQFTQQATVPTSSQDNIWLMLPTSWQTTTYGMIKIPFSSIYGALIAIKPSTPTALVSTSMTALSSKNGRISNTLQCSPKLTFGSGYVILMNSNTFINMTKQGIF